MPWTAKDAEGHTKEADSAAMQKMWAEVANATRQRELAKGTPAAECDAIAVRAANAAVAKAKQKTSEGMSVATDTLLEFCDSRGVTLGIDRQRGVITGVKILGLESRNGRTYPKETAARAVGLYEGAKVNLNHPKGNPGGPRDYQDRIGTLRNVRVEQGDGGIRGDFHFNPKHSIAEQLLWDAEHAPENVGFSHNVEAKTSRRGDKTIVEEIIRVQSVDLVADPATTRGLYEQHKTPTEKDTQVEFTELTEVELRAKRPDLLKAIADAALAEHAESEAEKAKDVRLKALTEQVESLTKEKAVAVLAKTIEAELTAAKLPATAVTEVFRCQLLAAKDADARKILIEDRRTIATGKPQSREQHIAEGVENLAAVTDGKSFARAITA